MQRFLTSVSSWCSRWPSRLRLRRRDAPHPGRLLKGGQAFIPRKGEVFRSSLSPSCRGKPRHTISTSRWWIRQPERSRPAGKDLKGMPPGKYRVAVELMKKKKDLFGGKYDVEKSPFVVDVDANTKEIVIDLDKS